MNAYDEVPYTSVAFRETHPERLAAIARLHGLDAPDPTTARILELGCAAGGNLIPMGLRMPGCTALGVDLSPVQVDEALDTIATLGLSNIEIRCQDLSDLRDEEPFDYIIAHGVYSWVAPEVQAHLLRICRTLLSEEGVAYVSYNALPGCGVFQSLRDLALFHIDGLDDPERRCAEARGVLQFLAESIPTSQSRHGLVQREVQRLLGMQNFFLRHDLLAERNEALYLTQFLDRTEMAYLDDALLISGTLRPEVRGRLDALDDRLEREQLEDWLFFRRFHRTLLVHPEREVHRDRSADALRSLALESVLRPEGETTDGQRRFRSPEGKRFTTGHPLMIAAMDWLWEHPGGMAYEQLLDEACSEAGVEVDQAAHTVLSQGLIHCMGRLFVHPLTAPRRLAWPPPERPASDPLVRHQVASGVPGVSTLRHAALALGAVDRQILLYADGSRSHSELLDAVRADVASGVLSLPESGDDDRLAQSVPARIAKLSHEGCFT